MRTVTAIAADGEQTLDIKIRPMTRREVKGLKKYGYTAFGFNGKAGDLEDGGSDLDDMMEAPMKLVLSDEQRNFLEDCSMNEFKRVWGEIQKETFLDEEAEKNSESSSSGKQTKTA